MKVINPNWKTEKRYAIWYWRNTNIIVDMDDILYQTGLHETLMFKTKIRKATKVD